MNRLKPCPFCGADAMTSYNSVYDYQAYCTNDSCFMSKIIMEDMETEEQAIAAWNNRSPRANAAMLDKLCEWLAKNASWYATEIDGDPEEWKSILTEWMEELHG